MNTIDKIVRAIKTELNSAKKSLTEDDFMKIIEFLNAKKVDEIKGLTKNEIGEFYYLGCQKFDRFVIPTPYVVDPLSKQYFEKFLKKLKSVENDSTNTAIFELHKIQWDIYDFLNQNKLAPSVIGSQFFQEKIKHLKSIEIPNNNEKKKEFNDFKRKVITLLSSIKNKTLKTKIKTRIPVSPVQGHTKIITNWQGINTMVFFYPKWGDMPQSIIQSQNKDNTFVSLTLSQWQSGYCDIEIEIEGFLDHSNPSQILASHPTEKLPIEVWPSASTYTYDILEKVTWKIREVSKLSGRWLLLPNDVATIKFELLGAGNTIDWIVKDPPGLLIKGFVSNDQRLNELEISLDRDVTWHQKCKILAHSYLETGATNEALFWLNVATEALFENRSVEICDRNNIDFDELSSGKSYWANAREVVQQSHPEIVEKINWPEERIGIPSWYTKIKFICKEIELKKSKKEILRNYNKVQKYRNALFHGASDDRISYENAKKAFDAHEWLEENFKQKFRLKPEPNKDSL
jgi:hypothetical protein